MGIDEGRFANAASWPGGMMMMMAVRCAQSCQIAIGLNDSAILHAQDCSPHG